MIELHHIEVEGWLYHVIDHTTTAIWIFVSMWAWWSWAKEDFLKDKHIKFEFENE